MKKFILHKIYTILRLPERYYTKAAYKHFNIFCICIFHFDIILTLSFSVGRGAAMIIESLLLFYHINCFKCCVCHVQLGDGLNGTDVRVRNHKLHCQNCYSSDDGIKFSCVWGCLEGSIGGWLCATFGFCCFLVVHI